MTVTKAQAQAQAAKFFASKSKLSTGTTNLRFGQSKFHQSHMTAMTVQSGRTTG